MAETWVPRPKRRAAQPASTAADAQSTPSNDPLKTRPEPVSANTRASDV